MGLTLTRRRPSLFPYFHDSKKPEKPISANATVRDPRQKRGVSERGWGRNGAWGPWRGAPCPVESPRQATRGKAAPKTQKQSFKTAESLTTPARNPGGNQPFGIS